jgi:23S rRNA pseudouridine2605 synthase
MTRSKKSESIESDADSEKRINRVLAAAGFGSRRQCEELITQGRVEIDGEVCESLSRKVDPAKSKISVDGEALRRFRPVYFALNKPSGVVCTNRDPQGRTRLVDLVPGNNRLFPIGRLDRASVGLIILTNDGELSQRLTHPKYEVPKTYYVVVQGQITEDHLQRMRRGIRLAEGFAKVDSIKIRRVRKLATDLEMTLTEGKNREIRRVLARLGHKVMLLRRIAIASLRLATLEEGMHRPLTSTEVQALYQAAEIARRAKNNRKSEEKETPEKSQKTKPKPKRVRDIEKSVDEHFEDHFDDSESTTFDKAALVEVAPHWEDDESLGGFDPEGGVIDYESDDDDIAPIGTDSSSSPFDIPVSARRPSKRPASKRPTSKQSPSRREGPRVERSLEERSQRPPKKNRFASKTFSSGSDSGTKSKGTKKGRPGKRSQGTAPGPFKKSGSAGKSSRSAGSTGKPSRKGPTSGKPGKTFSRRRPKGK